MTSLRFMAAATVVAASVTAGCSATHTPTVRPSATSAKASATAATPGPTTVPHFDHIVVVVLENHSYSDLIGQSDAPFLNHLASSGAALTRSYAITHPSQPNYLALFSGSTQGVTDNSCPHTFAAPNLASALLANGFSFVGYSEDLPVPGFVGCTSGAYARKHVPWVNFSDVPDSVNQPLTAFPKDYTTLPTLAFVIPDLDHDMHDGTVAQGDHWVQTHLQGYAQWATIHDSLLIVTTDEDDRKQGNRITTIVSGAHVRIGDDDTRTNHYGVLRTLLDSLRIPAFGGAATARPLTGLWTP